ncbi:MAG: SusC/RagA family TonB-linked outer membrane protein [Tannerella sp.]|jgi:iron complex outermembrane receptor protein|nr:SusC/RagA family TonB-linked outer membrane protein [Tannerella sp.]
MNKQLKRSGRKFILLLCWAVQAACFPAGTFAQQAVVTGTVNDAYGIPVAGVNIQVAGTVNGAVSDANGAFSIQTPSLQARLVFSFIGYVTREVELQGRNSLQIVLAEDSRELDEVVVVGYGKASRRDITGAVSTMKAPDVNTGVFTSPAQMLQGKVPGLSVTRSGDPNETPSMVLRGQSTLRTGQAMEPFFVIDGIPGASISLVAPEDIVSMDILRDAASTAIYGSRAANGVIIITTRRPQGYLSYNGYVAAESVSKRLKMMTGDQLRAYVSNALQEIDNVPDAGTDWQDEVQQTAFSHNHNVSFGGSGKSGTYNAGLNYMNNQGIIRQTGLERYILRTNVEQKLLGDRLVAGLNVSHSNTKQMQIFEEVLQNMLTFLPTVPVKGEDGAYSENFQRTGGYGNPVAMLYNDVDHRSANVTLGNVYLNLDLFGGLTYHFNYTIQNDEHKRNIYHNSNSTIRKGTNGYAVRNTYADVKYLAETYIDYDRRIRKHEMKLMAGYSWEENRTNDGFQAANSDFVSDDISYRNLALGNAPSKVSSDDMFGTATVKTLRMISFYGRANYQFDNRYLFQLSVRRDGSSAFGINNRWGTFPSVSAGWKMHNEAFMQNQHLFTEVRWRASYGISGNTLGFDPMNALLKYGKQGITTVNGKDIVAIGPTQNANPDLKWESTAMFNIGLDLSLLDNWNITLEYYDKLTKDLIWEYAVPTTEYLVDRLLANVGRIRNRGVELQAGGGLVRTKDFRWNTNLTLSHNQNVVESITSEQFTDTYRLVGDVGGSGQSGLTCQIIREGSPIGTFYLPKYAGLDENSVSVFQDAEGQKVSQPTSKDYQEFTGGNAAPSLLYGWQHSLSYKNLDFGFFLRGVYGNYILNATRSWLFKIVEANQFNIMADAADEPREDIRAHFNSDRYIESGSYLRLDNVTLGYTFSPHIPALKNIRLYCTVNNAFVLTGYKGIDPEIQLGGLTPGIDNRNFYPKTRSFLFGLSFNLN